MYAYVDESGNTGNRIFDPEPPVFMTAAMITKSNFDMARRSDVHELAKKLGVRALHANELGMARIELIAPRLLSIVKKAEARFFVSRLEKRYLAATKVYDTYFDQGENLAVPWNAYWIRSMRLTMMFKLANFVITEEAAQVVWDCVTASKEARSKELFVEGAKLLLAGVNNLRDKRARQIAAEALQWAIDNPENFTTHIRLSGLQPSLFQAIDVGAPIPRRLLDESRVPDTMEVRSRIGYRARFTLAHEGAPHLHLDADAVPAGGLPRVWRALPGRWGITIHACSPCKV